MNHLNVNKAVQGVKLREGGGLWQANFVQFTIALIDKGYGSTQLLAFMGILVLSMFK